jgi:gluconate kinase
MLDDNIEMLIKKPKIYRGKIRNIAPNPRFAFVHVKEKNGCVKMEIPRKYTRYMKSHGMVYLEQLEDYDREERYIMVVPKIV